MAIFSSAVATVIGKTGLKKRTFMVIWLGIIVIGLCACQAGVYHTVKPGQTLYRICHTYKVDARNVARVNGINDPTQLRIGTKVYIPGAKHLLPVTVVPAKPIATPKTQSVTKKRPTPKPKSKPSTVRKKPQKNGVKSVSSKATNVKKLQWPVRGKVVRYFSKNVKAGGGRGIEIAVKSGTHVNAAEAGKAIYSGDGVAGYGYLIILQHENDLFTVYGFNRKNIIKQGDYVSKGERIALSGTPPSGGKSRLHFEVRNGKIAVNPILYLP